jgi:hypothetical protein
LVYRGEISKESLRIERFRRPTNALFYPLGNLEVMLMCRNIKTLFNFDPPVTDEEVRAASLQFVRKISGFNKPSKANEGLFLAAVDEVAGISTRLLRSLETNAPPKNREEEAAKARARAAERFGA